MKITGFQLTYRLKELQDAREIATAQFNDALFTFASDSDMKLSPVELARVQTDAERTIAALQVAQARYNLAVTVDVQGERMTLHEAVKLVGGASRMAKLWKEAAKRTDGPGYGYLSGQMSRDKDHEYARRTVSVQECLERSREATRWASALRQAIQLANGTEIDMEGLDPALFQ